MEKNISKYDYTACIPNDYTGFVPLGSGRTGVSVWTEKKTDCSIIHFLYSATDSFSELGRLLKLGKAMLILKPAVFDDNTKIHLSLQDAVLSIKSDIVEIRMYMHANYDVLNISLDSKVDVDLEYIVDNYRDKPLSSHLLEEDASNYAMSGTAKYHNISESADIVDLFNGGLLQYHHNTNSCYNYSFLAQNLTDIDNDKVYVDPYINRIFGTYAISEDMQPVENESSIYLTARNKKQMELNILLYSDTLAKKYKKNESYKNSTNSNTIQEYFLGMLNMLNKFTKIDSKEMLDSHKEEWKQYWEEYYIYAYGSEQAELLTKAWIYQKYFNRLAGRAEVPIKFNGSIYVTYPVELSDGRISWDYRRWGAAFWIQNTRHIYWNMLHSGDYQSMYALYNTMKQLVPISRHRSMQYFSHEGMLLPETVTIGGLYCMSNYGIAKEDNKRADAQSKLHTASQMPNRYIKWHYNGMLELSYLMLLGAVNSKRKDYLDIALEFSYHSLLFFYEHFDIYDGKLLMTPVSSLETYQYCVNDLPDIAGLHAVITELENLESIDNTLLHLITKLKKLIPDYPKDEDTLLACETLIDKKRRNHENPELYGVFPFYQQTIADSENELFSYALNAFHTRKTKAGVGWSQDCIQAPLLGLNEETLNILINQAKTTDSRYSFYGIYGPNYDETPDQDHANGLSIGIIHSLLISQKDKHYLFPAWPKEWSVQFKLPLYKGEYVAVKYDNGNLDIEWSDKKEELCTVIDTKLLED